ncbi:multiubiquitin domain-containing protein [Amycolatopsis sp. NPDC051061]|uniref:multiubiquitin domain-containing protein n=1 Tax=Amycolatopsis sp. NPDC051061 TaxID=3155042 RepID=UPI00342A17BB
MADEDRPHRKIRISIDGRPFEVEQNQPVTAAELLRLAGLDPNGYDLAEVHGHGNLEKFEDSKVVAVHPNEKFVSIRQVAPVA